MGRLRSALARFFMRIRERELVERWHSSKAKKDETLGKRAELELRRKIGEGRGYQLVRKQRMEERELKRTTERFLRFLEGLFQRQPPLVDEKPKQGFQEGVT